MICSLPEGFTQEISESWRADQGSNLAKMEVAPCTQTVKHKRHFTFVNKPKKQSRLDKSACHYLASREENEYYELKS